MKLHEKWVWPGDSESRSFFLVPLLYVGQFAPILRLCEIQNCLFMKAPSGQCYSVLID